MKRILLAGAALALLAAGSAGAAEKKVFALVPKALGVPFYADAEKGCKEAAAKLGAECLFTGPAQLDDAEQTRIVRDLVTRKVAGIAIAPNNADSISNVIAAALDKKIPVVTFDSDAPKSKRIAFIGTNNEAGGEAAGEAFAKALPNGGTYAVLTGGLSASNLNDRIKGFKSKLGDKFKEVSGSPFSCNDDSSVGVQVIQDILAKNPNIDGIFFSGGWPMFAPQAYTRALKNKQADLKAGKFVIVSFDTLPTQVKLLKDGYATTLIGQRPLAMGMDSVDQLDKLAKGEKVPPVTDTGVDIVDKSNVEKFAAGN
ncbi:sugar ABC transporter substrate-binding protein [Aureimonas endophytica]|uniref:Sugar ABC transporter substrate-binding protein n=1 Tax=Aureimonas endophytica TaxID=2027858 RepID=A0A916ZG11_9HYPH|nr:sugar-binding protein [Aureimonas endophytica]GGD95408.1 sugar ABC transporter substrate-binding protein [Aureimonas endophytica]